MKRDVSFNEQQRFKQVWILLLMLVVSIPILIGFLRQVVMGEPFGDKPISDLGVTIMLLFIALVNYFIFSIRLETIVDQNGITYRFFPFHFSTKTIAWDQVSKAYIRKYNPILEYGGWGIRWGAFGKGDAYNIAGNMGLQLELKSGKKLLFGTQRSDELDRVIEQLGVKTAE